MPNANLEMMHPKKKNLLKILKATPLQFMLKYTPWLADKIAVFHPTERLIEYPFIHENIPFGGGSKKILDVGSGNSILPFELASKGYEVYAIDSKRGFYKILHHSNFTFVQGDIRKTDFPDNFFDIVTAVSSIEHIGLGSSNIDLGKDKKATKEIARILKPGGMFLITVPFGKRGLYPSKDCPSWRVYDLPALNKLLPPLEIKTMRFALLNGVSWKPGSLQEVENIDSLSQSRWIASKAIAMAIAKKPRFL